MVETRHGARTEPDLVPRADELNKDIKGGQGAAIHARAGALRARRGGRGAWWTGGLTDQQSYLMLALGHLALAIPLMFSSKLATKAIFGKAADPPEDQHSHLLGLYASGLLSSAAAAFSLEEAARRNMLHTWSSDVLKLGLMAHFVANTLLMLYYPATLTILAAAVEWLAAAATFMVPAQHALFEPADRRRIWNDLRRAPRELGSFFNFRRLTLTSVMYAAFTLAFPLTGLSYFLAPKFTLIHTFGYDYGKSTQMLWKAIGGGALMSFLPAITLVLKNKAEHNNLADPTARALNLGLLGTSVGHLLVFGPILARGHGGFMLPALLGTWVTVLVTSMLGLSAPELAVVGEQIQEAAREQYQEQMGGVSRPVGEVGGMRST